MSITNLIDQNKPSDKWVNLRCNTLTVDSEFVLKAPALVIGAIDVIEGTQLYANTQNLLSTSFYPSSYNNASIPLTGISYNGANINVSAEGYYLVDIKLSLQFGTVVPGDYAFMEAIFWDNTQGRNVIYDNITLDTEHAKSIVLNKIVYLNPNRNYQIIIKNNDILTPKPVKVLEETGTYTSSYFSIVKLFNFVV